MPVDADHAESLAAARAADQQAFQTLVAAHQRVIHLHCYRMLGSFHDAEDATQETLLQAWRSRATYEGRAPLQHWLYRIATTTCLKKLARRARDPVSRADLTHLQPYPDQLLDRLPAADGDPAAATERRETVALAFIEALQRLPATQRAVLILRDVLAWPAAEVADLLDTTVVAVNSALQRARTTMRMANQQGSAARLDSRDQEVVDRFVAAWQRSDVLAVAELLREDAVLRMPPERIELCGRATIANFFATVPAAGRLDRIKLTVTAANGQSALAAQLLDETGRAEPYGLMVLTIVCGAIITITGFPEPALFHAFGLPT
jgi:RNA polymerase sigma-70 factor, ECF subfamily